MSIRAAGLVTLIGATTVLLFFHRPQAGATPAPSAPAPAAPGPATPILGVGTTLPWQANRAIHPGFEVNLATGNVLFRVVTASYRLVGLEPSPPTTFFFNTLATSRVGDFTAGFDLGAGWSTTAGSRLVFLDSDTALCTFGDGMQVLFDRVGSVWDPMEGFPRMSLQPSGSDWIVHDLRRNEYRFDANGDLLEIRSATGPAYSIQRGGGVATSATDPVDRVVQYLHAGGKLDTVVNGAGDVWTCSYDASGRLDQVDDPDGSTLLTYDGSGRIETYTDLDGGLWQFEYFTTGPWAGRIETVTDPQGHPEAYDYEVGPAGDVTVLTDTRGHVWRYSFDDATLPALVETENPLGKKWKRTVDDERLLRRTIDPLDRHRVFGYDSHGRRTLVVDPGGRITNYTYDALHNVRSATTAGERTDYHYEDPQHPTLLTRVEYPEDEQGNRESPRR